MGKGFQGRTPLGGAVIDGHLNVVKYLISQPNVDIDSQENDGSTPLILAAYFNHLKVARFLFENGADTSIKDNDGQTALTLDFRLCYIFKSIVVSYQRNKEFIHA